MFCFTCGRAAGRELRALFGSLAFYYRIALPERRQGIGRCQDSQDSCGKRERLRTFWREIAIGSRVNVSNRPPRPGRRVGVCAVADPPHPLLKNRFGRRRGKLLPRRQNCGRVAHRPPVSVPGIQRGSARGQICQRNQGFTKITEKNRVLVSLANES